MSVALASLPVDESLKTAAAEFLELDYRTLTSRSAFEEAFHGLSVAQLLLAPMNNHYRQTLSEARKLLSQYEALFCRWEARWFREDLAGELDRLFKGLTEEFNEAADNDEARRVASKIIKAAETNFKKRLTGPPNMPSVFKITQHVTPLD